MTAENSSFTPAPLEQAQDVVEAAFADYMRSPTDIPGAEELADAEDIVREVEAAKEIEQVYTPGEPIPPGSDQEIELLTKFTALHLQMMVLRGEIPEPGPSTEAQRAKAEAREAELDALAQYVADGVSGRRPIGPKEDQEGEQ